MPHKIVLDNDLQRRGPMVDILLAIPQSLEDVLVQEGKPVPKSIVLRALIDTGAGITAIRQGLIAPLGLQPIGSVMMLTAGAPAACGTYNVKLIVPFDTLAYNFAVSVVEMPLTGQPGLDCLIGRDVLERAIFTYSGADNRFTLSL